MIKVQNLNTPSGEQWQSVIMGMRNPLNSWDKADSYYEVCDDGYSICFFGPNDLHLMQTLTRSGPDHRKFTRMLPVWMDVTAPLYWWKEADQYKVGTVTNSCSTMHKIADKEFTLDDFSHEHLNTQSTWALNLLIDELNVCRDKYIASKDKNDWWQMIQLLPSSYNQKRTLYCNYEVLYNIYCARKQHKLDEWQEFCRIIKEDVPYFREIFHLKEEIG